MTKINNEIEEIITDKTEINNHKITLEAKIRGLGKWGDKGLNKGRDFPKSS